MIVSPTPAGRGYHYLSPPPNRDRPRSSSGASTASSTATADTEILPFGLPRSPPSPPHDDSSSDLKTPTSPPEHTLADWPLPNTALPLSTAGRAPPPPSHPPPEPPASSKGSLERSKSLHNPQEQRRRGLDEPLGSRPSESTLRPSNASVRRHRSLSRSSSNNPDGFPELYGVPLPPLPQHLKRPPSSRTQQEKAPTSAARKPGRSARSISDIRAKRDADTHSARSGAQGAMNSAVHTAGGRKDGLTRVATNRSSGGGGGGGGGKSINSASTTHSFASSFKLGGNTPPTSAGSTTSLDPMKSFSVSSTSSLPSRGRRTSSGSAATSLHLVSSHQSTTTTANHAPAPQMPAGPIFKFEMGRRWLRCPTLPYPLPVDLPEIHRQSLRMMLQIRLYGAPFCSKHLLRDSSTVESDTDGTDGDRADTSNDDTDDAGAGTPRSQQPPSSALSRGKTSLRRQLAEGPKRVLEVACGSALWSGMCHDYLRKRGVRGVSFTGVDIAPVAPSDMSRNGLDWRFVQHDLRRTPWPFADEEFDFIFVHDFSLVGRVSDLKGSALSETARLLRPGGVVEVWESDHVFRTLVPGPAVPPGTAEENVQQAEACGAYVMGPSTPFSASRNRFISDYNKWVEAALVKRDLTPSPCAITEWGFGTEIDKLAGVESRRLAIPLGETRWEREAKRRPPLTGAQRALRRTALLTTVQFIESMEAVLKKESGMVQDEWDRWWAGMMKDLLRENGTVSGECLEMGAWWGVRC